MEAIHLISVCETASRDLTASGARLVVRISGQSFFTGTQAFKKAKEVAACIAALAECGIPEGDVRLLDVSTEVETGLLSKSSLAVYDLEVKCPSIELLGPAVAAIASQKNSKIYSIGWDYTDLAATKQDVLQEAVRAAKRSATAIADSAGVALLGLHKMSYDVSGLDTETELPGRQGWLAPALRYGKAMRTFSEEAPGLTLAHTTRLAVKVTADFLVGALGDGA